MPDTDSTTGATPDSTTTGQQETSSSGSTETTEQAATTSSDGDEEALGDAGRRALVSERQARREAEHKLTTLQREVDELKEASKSEAEKAVSKARREGHEEALAKVNARLVRAEAKAVAAAEGWRDPEDALLYVDVETVKVSDQGDVDSKSIKDVLADISKAKPYLLAEQSTNGRPRTSRPSSAAIKQGKAEDGEPDMDAWLRRRRPTR